MASTEEEVPHTTDATFEKRDAPAWMTSLERAASYTAGMAPKEIKVSETAGALDCLTCKATDPRSLETIT